MGANLVDHPNRPSVAVTQYAAECYSQATAAETAGSPHCAAILRAVGHRLREIATAAEVNYETKVSDLILAALDVRDGGGWLTANREEAIEELVRCTNNLRTGKTRNAA